MHIYKCESFQFLTAPVFKSKWEKNHRIHCKVFIQVCCNIEDILFVCAEAAFINKLTVTEQCRELYLLCCGRKTTVLIRDSEPMFTCTPVNDSSGTNKYYDSLMHLHIG